MRPVLIAASTQIWRSEARARCRGCPDWSLCVPGWLESWLAVVVAVAAGAAVAGSARLLSRMAAPEIMIIRMGAILLLRLHIYAPRPRGRASTVLPR